MDVLADLQTRLSTLSVPVLTPERAQEPLVYAEKVNGRVKVGGAQDLAAYLADHPEGFVQLHRPQPTGVALGGAGAVYLVQIDVLTPDESTTTALTDLVRRAVAAHPGVRHSRYTLLTPPGLRDQGGAILGTFVLTARVALNP